VGLLRSLRRQPPRHARIAISAADPLNLAGIVTPGDRVPSIASHRVLLDDGVPVASLEAGRLRRLLPTDATTPERSLRDALLRRRLPPELRALY
jgi:ATP-dependent Lhr-like helicase